MKKISCAIPILTILALLCCGSCAGSFDQKAPVTSIQGSFFNIDTTGRSALPHLSEMKSWSGSAWRGERISTQLLIRARETEKQIERENERETTIEIQLKASDLAGKKNTLITSAQINLYEIKYVMTDEYGDGCDKTGMANYDSSMVADVLEPLKSPLDLKPGEASLFWISIDIPSDAIPGNYSGRISVTGEKAKGAEFQIEVEVLSHELPPPRKWDFHLDLWQNPYAVARYYDVDPWSSKHFEKMRPTMEMLAGAGQKCITTTLTGKPWGGQTFDPFESMIIKNLRADGSWSYDYTNFDAWVEFAMECGIDRQINCYSMVSWSREYDYYDEAKGEMQAVSCKPGDKDYNELWIPFLKDFNRHLLYKNWQDISTISMDERSMEDLIEVIRLVDREAPGLKIAFAGLYHPELDDDLYDLSVASVHIVTGDNLARRKSAGFKTTFYVCCVEEKPNTFSFSNPAEASYLAWYAANREFDGMLRWSYNSWTEDPLHDSRFRRFPAGDTYMVYPGGLSSVRFERMREGIQDFEKINILKRELIARGSDESKEKLKLLNAELEKFDIESLTSIPASIVLAEGKHFLNQLSK